MRVAASNHWLGWCDLQRGRALTLLPSGLDGAYPIHRLSVRVQQRGVLRAQLFSFRPKSVVYALLQNHHRHLGIAKLVRGGMGCALRPADEKVSKYAQLWPTD